MTHHSGGGDPQRQRAKTTTTSSMVGWGGLALVLVLAGAGVLLTQLWSNGDEPRKPRQRDEFASDQAGGAANNNAAATGAGKPVAFDGKRAMGYLEAICKIGPRISGTEGMKKQQQLIEKHFKALDAKVSYQRFTAKQKSTGIREVPMANMVVSYHPERARRVILCSHYDTRPLADKEPQRKRWTEPFVSANDGASGVALLMELGNHMKGLKTEVGVDFVFFDGEEYIYSDGDEYFFGSRHFGKEYAKLRKQKKVTYLGAVLLDMVAGKGASFPVEQHSWESASSLVRQVWQIAKDLKCDAFLQKMSDYAVLDDHVELNKAGIPAIDIIDFDYPHWHKLSDVPKNCSAEPMEQVAKVCSVWIQRAR